MSRVLGRLWWLAAFAVGCSPGSKYDVAATDTAFGADTGDSDVDSGEMDDGAEPVWWELGASLVLSAGVLDPNASALTVRLLDAEVVPTCEESVGLLSAEAEATTPDADIYAWWRLVPAALQEDCGGHDEVLPAEILLGVGALAADVRAVLGPAGYDSVEDSLNGAYASLNDGDDVYIFGVAGTDDAFAGLTPAASAAPLADGTWSLVALFPFDY